MRFMRLLYLFLMGGVVACQPPQPAPGKQPPQEGKFFPVSDFITRQIREVDSLRLPLTKFFMPASGRMDSASIRSAEFSALARHYFMQPDINDPLLKPQYTETSFADQTIAGITLT